MESGEFYTPNSGAQKPPLRLMRFSFEPNESLLKETRMFVQESRRLTTPIRFYASRQLLLEVPDYYRHEGSLQRLGRDFAAHNEPLPLAPMVRDRQLSPETTRFQFLLSDQEAFDSLTSLEVKPDRRAEDYYSYEYAAVQQLPNKIEGQPTRGHYLFVDIASDALIGAKERRMAEHAFASKAAKRNFFLHTIALTMIRDIPPKPVRPEPSTEQTPLDDDDDELPEAG